MNARSIMHLITSLKIGGAEAVLLTLLKELKQEHPHDVHTVVFFHDGPLRQQIEMLGIQTYHLKGRWFLYDPFFLYKLYRTFKTLKPDVVHSSLWAACFLARIYTSLLSVPLVCAVHVVMQDHGRLRNVLDRYLPLHPHTYIAVSPSVARSLQQDIGLKPQQITTIVNGISLPAPSKTPHLEEPQVGKPHSKGPLGEFSQASEHHGSDFCP